MEPPGVYRLVQQCICCLPSHSASLKQMYEDFVTQLKMAC